MILAKHPPPIGKGGLKQRMADPDTGHRTGVTEMFGDGRVVGWSSPSTRRQSARVASYSGMARVRSPADR